MTMPRFFFYTVDLILVKGISGYPNVCFRKSEDIYLHVLNVDRIVRLILWIFSSEEW